MPSKILSIIHLGINRVLQVLTPAQLVVLNFVGLVAACFLSTKQHPKVSNAVYYGYKSIFEPRIFLQFRFSTTAFYMIAGAYKKITNVPFVMRRFDADINVLPMKYLDEVRVLPRRKLNLWKAQLGNTVPLWTYMYPIWDSDLHIRALKNQLSPKLEQYLSFADDELDSCLQMELPQLNDWTEVDIQHSLRVLIASMTARVFMGELASKDWKWIETTMAFSIDLWTTAFTLRMFPTWMYRLVAGFIPARRRVYEELKYARKLVAQLTQQHFSAIARQEMPEDTILGWMLDHGSEKERSEEVMATFQCGLSLLGIHTVAGTVTTILFDLCTHSQWIGELQAEIYDVLVENGRPNEGKISIVAWLGKLDKMDSFITESQRIQPQILINPERIALESITLQDGTEIPAGTRIGFAGHYYANDPAIVEDPDRFDPLRNYRKRQKNKGAAANMFTASQPNAGARSFGYGTQACPGRHFSVGEIKLILVRLLLEFEFKFPEGKSKPQNMYADEMVFMDHSAKLMMRKKT